MFILRNMKQLVLRMVKVFFFFSSPLCGVPWMEGTLCACLYCLCLSGCRWADGRAAPPNLEKQTHEEPKRQGSNKAGKRGGKFISVHQCMYKNYRFFKQRKRQRVRKINQKCKALIILHEKRKKSHSLTILCCAIVCVVYKAYLYFSKGNSVQASCLRSLDLQAVLFHQTFGLSL